MRRLALFLLLSAPVTAEPSVLQRAQEARLELRFSEAQALAEKVPGVAGLRLRRSIASAMGQRALARLLRSKLPHDNDFLLEEISDDVAEGDPAELRARLHALPGPRGVDFYCLRARISAAAQDTDSLAKDLAQAWEVAHTREGRWSVLTLYASYSSPAEYERRRGEFLDRFGSRGLPLAYSRSLAVRLAYRHHREGNDEDARITWTEQLSLARSLHLVAEADEALGALAEIAYGHGDKALALTLTRESLADDSKYSDPESRIRHLLDCGTSLSRFGERKFAYPELKLLVERIPDPKVRARVQLNVADLLRNNARLALEFGEAARRTFVRLGDKNHAMAALYRIQQIYMELDDLPAALQAARDGMALQGESGWTAPSYASLVNMVANVQSRQDVSESFRVLREGVKRESRPEGKEVLLSTTLRYASSYERTAENRAAFDELQALLPSLRSRSRQSAISSLLSFPSDPATVLNLRKKMISDLRDELRAAGDRPSSERITLLISLATHLRQAGQPVEELDCLLQALEVARVLKSPARLYDAVYAVIGAYRARDKHEAILALLDSLDMSQFTAIDIYSLGKERVAALGAKGPPTAALEASQANVVAARRTGSQDYLTGALLDEVYWLNKLDRWEEAGKIVQALVQSTEKTQGSSFRAYLLCQLATIRERQGEEAAARALYEESLAASLKEPRASTMVLVARRYAGFLRRTDSDAALALLEKTLPEVAKLGNSEAPLGSLAVEVAEIYLERKQLEKARQLLDAYPQVAPAYRRVSALAGLVPEQGGSVGNEPDLTSILDRIRLENPEAGRMLALRSTNLPAIQSRLRPDQLLVCYYPLGNSLWIVGIRKDRGFARKIDVAALRLQQLCKAWRESAQHPEVENLGENEALLHELLIAPIREWVPSRGRLLVVPAGPLWYVPLGALRDPSGSYLAERLPCSYLSSGDLLRLADGNWHPYHLGKALAMGAPSDLPEAAHELEKVAAALPNCQIAGGSLSRREALDQPGLTLLHLATHGHNVPGDPQGSYLKLADGNLTVPEIQRLRLGTGSLVVLSTCESGLGQENPDSEPVSLATAMTDAGASTVISGLWEVDDKATSVLFGEFYRRLGAGASPLEALQAAQKVCRSQFPQPYFWAGFTLLGCPD